VLPLIAKPFLEPFVSFDTDSKKKFQLNIFLPNLHTFKTELK